MMKFGKSAMVALAMSALIAGLTGCQKKEGSVERAGKEEIGRASCRERV